MAGEVNHIQAYWRPRAESAKNCAIRLISMLDGLAEAHFAFAHWNRQACSRAAANLQAWRMPPNIGELTTVFEDGRQFKDVPRIPWPELGYWISAWNGLDPPYGTSLMVCAGGYTDSRPFPNTVDLKVNRAGPDNKDLTNGGVLKSALLAVATAWDPDYAVVVPWDYWSRSFGDRGYPNLRSGWMTYLAPKYANQIKPPPAAIVEPVPGDGMLLLATEEQFSMDSPAHLAVADAIQKALDPLQDMVPPGRDDQPRAR
ncbi:MAG: immunity 52 family protein [Alphaproteobacteria bacterium]|nr:immunity 52 family protein [Alphaproteobacteria bacterium]